MGDGVSERSDTIREWCERFESIGHALGLKGRFLVNFGHVQILEQARKSVPGIDADERAEFENAIWRFREGGDGVEIDRWLDRCQKPRQQ